MAMFGKSKDSNETRTIHSKSDNIEIMIVNETDKVIQERFNSLLQKYQKSLEESMKGIVFAFDNVIYCTIIVIE